MPSQPIQHTRQISQQCTHSMKRNVPGWLCVQEHTTCVTEHDKYAKGATKPGGYAASGFFGSGETAKPQDASGAAGLEFLSSRPPWKCSICNVSCTSQETLMGHASGAKHKRRVRPLLKHLL